MAAIRFSGAKYKIDVLLIINFLGSNCKSTHIFRIPFCSHDWQLNFEKINSTYYNIKITSCLGPQLLSKLSIRQTISGTLPMVSRIFVINIADDKWVVAGLVGQ